MVFTIFSVWITVYFFFSCSEVFVVALLPSPSICLCFLFHQAATQRAATKFPSSAVFNLIPIMTCLGLGAGTTGPPRIPPSQGCEHLSVMSFLEVQCTKNITNYFEEFCKFYRISPCVRVGIFILNDSTCNQRIRCICVVPTSFVFRRTFCAEQWLRFSVITLLRLKLTFPFELSLVTSWYIQYKYHIVLKFESLPLFSRIFSLILQLQFF